MFKKFNPEDDISSKALIKSSQQRAIFKNILDQYSPTGLQEEFLEAIIPKKESLQVVKCKDHLNLLLNEKTEVVFFNQRDGQYYPHLKSLHQCGDFMHILTIDEGSVKYIINGANIMCPGIVKEFATPIDIDTPVEIRAIGKTLPLAVGFLKMSSNDIIEKNKGIGVEILHVLGDGLWTLKPSDF